MDELKSLFMLTWRQPSVVAQRLLDYRIPAPAIMMAFGITVAINAILSTISLNLSPPPPEMQGLFDLISPLTFAGFIAAALLAMTAALTISGRILGGQGQFTDVLLMLVWIQSVMLVVEAALIVLMNVAPALVVMAALPAYVIALIWTVIFLRVAHRMNHSFRAFVAFVLGMLGLGFVLQFLLF